MFYVEEIKLNDAAALLAACGLTKPQGVDYTAGVFSMETGGGVENGGFRCTDSGSDTGGVYTKGDSSAAGGSGGVWINGRRLAATGSLKGDMIQAVAVDPAFQGEDLTAKVLTHLFAIARERGRKTLYLFTKPEKARQFISLGFRQAAKARPYAALLEWGQSGVKEYMEKLSAAREAACGVSGTLANIGALVMNCNPFTKGHRYLIEQAAARKEHVFVLAVEEDASLFSFADRLAMLQRGTAELKNVTVLSGGRYAVSALTFPSYFTKEENLAKAHAAMDAELFAACIAPALSADERFLGTEPLSKVTAIYNETLKERLPKHGIAVTEIPRFEAGGEAVSASRVRAELLKMQRAGRLSPEEIAASAALKELLPETTLEYLKKEEVLQRLSASLAEGQLPACDMQLPEEKAPSCSAQEVCHV